MKKAISLILSLIMLSALAVISAVPVNALVDEPQITAYYGHPTIDGKISDGEYATSYTMDKNTASAWVGDVGDSAVTWSFAWDENGLYYAGCINDATQTYRDASIYWVGIDCLEIAINPGNILPADQTTEGVFFSFGATKTGKVIGYRHNYADGLVTEKITAKASGHKSGSKSYTIEVMIPWELVQLDTDCTIGGKTDTHLDSTGFTPDNGTVFSVLPCAIDADTDDHIVAAYKFNNTDFIVRDFLQITLTGKPEETTEADTTEAETTVEVTEAVTTEEITLAETTAVQETSSEASTTEAAKDENTATGCKSSVALPIICMLAAVPAFIRRKRK